MPKTNEERLREEWQKHIEPFHDIPVGNIIEPIADFFLRHHKEFVESVRDIVTSKIWRHELPDIAGIDVRAARYAYNKALEEILSLPLLTLPINKKEDKNGHRINAKGELVFDDRCESCEAPKEEIL